MSCGKIVATYVVGAAVGIASWEWARYAGRNTLPPHPGPCDEYTIKDPLAREIAQRQLRERLGENSK